MNLRRRSIALITCLFCLSLAACGKEKEELGKDDAQDASPYTYVAKVIGTMEDDIGEVFFAGDKMYYSCYSWDEQTGVGGYSLKEAQITADGIVPGNESIALGSGETSIDRICIVPGGKLFTQEVLRPEVEGEFVTEEDYDEYRKKWTTYLCRYTLTGELEKQFDISEFIRRENLEYISGVMADQDDNMALIVEQKAYFFDAEGKERGNIDIGNWIDQMGYGKSGQPYITYYDSANGGYKVSKLDIKEKKTTPLDCNVSYVRTMGPGAEGELFLVDNSNLYEVDSETLECRQLCSLVDCDLIADYVAAVGALADGSLVLYSRDYETNTKELVRLDKMDSSQVVQKEVITVATLNNDSNLNELIVQFNKTNEKYKVKTKVFVDENADWTETTYSDAITNLQNDLVNNTSKIDLLYTYGDISIGAMVEKGLFEDLYPYLEKSSKVSREDYIPKVLEVSTIDGKLISLSRGFSIQTLVGKQEIFGTKEGWTLQEVEEITKRYPDSSLFNYANKQSILYNLLTMTWKQFMDEKNGTCSFDQDAFKSILTICAGYPDEAEWSENDKGYAAKFHDNDILLNDAYISSLQDLQNATCYFEDAPYTFIGYPTVDGSNGVVMTLSNAFSMMSKSENKDGAWAFLEYVASKPYDNWQDDYIFPSIKSVYEEKMKEATKEEYLMDENGEFILDEDGEKIPVNTGGSMSDSSGWTYEFHTPTKEEAAIVEALIEKAVPSNYTLDTTIMNIINEEAEPFFKGQKSVDEACSIIQSRISMYMKENM